MRLRFRLAVFCALAALSVVPAAMAQCRDAVVLVHGNGDYPSRFDNTYDELRARGWAANEIFRPSWGSKVCAACNDHNGSEETPVLDALVDAIAASCTGKIDVIGHSMGVTLAANEIVKHDLDGYVDTFVGIAGAWRGLNSCGTYPLNVATTTCGRYGLSRNSPLINSLQNKPLGDRVYSLLSVIDEIVCYGGVCTVGGVHSSHIGGEDDSFNIALGHFGLATYTATLQADLVE